MADDVADTDERITREQAAQRLGVSTATIDRYLRTGLLTSRVKNRVTGRVTLSAAEVEQLQRERER